MTWHLVLAHLLADYPLQTNWMAHNKRRPWVMIAHVGIHFLVMLLLVGQARSLLWPYLLALTAAHLTIDIGKETIHKLRPRWVTGPYVVDQLLHYLTIWLTGAWIVRSVGPVELPFSDRTAILAAAMLAGTYVWFISERIFVHAQASYLEEVQAQLWPRMLMRAAMLSGILWALLWPGGMSGSLAGVAVTVPYLKGKHRQRALLTDVMVSLILAVLASLAIRLW